MTVVRYLALTTLAGLLACTRAESQVGLTLDTKLPASFGQISNVVELDGDRVVFVETRDKMFLRADLTTGKVDTLGSRVETITKESPASQYKFPGWVARLGGDTVALVDFSAQRTTLWNERGEPIRVLAITEAAGTAPVLVYDAVGHGYKMDYRAILGGAAPGANARPDSIAVIRIRFGGGKVDTVAQLAAPVFGRAKFGEQVQEAATVFAPNEFVGVLPNGTAWVARGRENRVDWRTPDGKWTIGRKREFTPVPVTQADRERVLAQVREQGAQYGMPQNLAIEYPFAETKPPFDFALSRPNGEVWLQRPRAAEDAPVTYDVYSEKGSWQREVVFPKGNLLAGFGSDGAIYATIREGDKRTVGRYLLK
jgi:hypothetical protein